MDNFEPWVRYPTLTKKRLSEVAVIMRDVRDKAVLLHDADEGDNAWCLGCRIYARTCFKLRRASEQLDWLSVLQENEALRFTFAVGRVPLKFYRGDVGDAPGHCRVMSEAEAAAKQLLLDLGEIQNDDRLLRLVVETDNVGGMLNVTLTELDKTGRLTGKYVIPFDADSDALPALVPGFDPGPPSIQRLPETGTGNQKRRKEGDAK